jgi:hypothetical protein
LRAPRVASPLSGDHDAQTQWHQDP